MTCIWKSREGGNSLVSYPLFIVSAQWWLELIRFFPHAAPIPLVLKFRSRLLIHRQKKPDNVKKGISFISFFPRLSLSATPFSQTRCLVICTNTGFVEVLVLASSHHFTFLISCLGFPSFRVSPVKGGPLPPTHKSSTLRLSPKTYSWKTCFLPRTYAWLIGIDKKSQASGTEDVKQSCVLETSCLDQLCWCTAESWMVERQNPTAFPTIQALPPKSSNVHWLLMVPPLGMEPLDEYSTATVVLNGPRSLVKSSYQGWWQRKGGSMGSLNSQSFTLHTLVCKQSTCLYPAKLEASWTWCGPSTLSWWIHLLISSSHLKAGCHHKQFHIAFTIFKPSAGVEKPLQSD